MSPDELLELSQRLSQEKLYTHSERENIARLNQDVSVAAAQVCKTAWLVKQQRTNLSRLTQDDPSLCCLRANLLGMTNFVDAFHHLNYHESKFSSFLKMLRDEPSIVAEFIAGYSSTVSISETIDILIGALYGSCVAAQEEILLAAMLRKLAHLLMSNLDNEANRVLTKDRCAWCQIYRAYTDCLTSCKLFLAAALHQPIINLLTQDDWFYDIEPNKSLERFHPAQKAIKFGTPGMEEYATRTKQYRDDQVKKLHKFAMDFINHIKEAMLCFPAPLQWLIAHMHAILIETGRYDELQSRSLCTELVFDLFICPAIIDPMLYGLTSEVPVSHIARHNLIQVARMLQVLSQGQRSDERLRVPSLYSLFDQDCLTEVMNSILEREPSETLRLRSGDVFNRSSIFIGIRQLNTLVQAFRETINSQVEDSELRQRTDTAIKSLPTLQKETGLTTDSPTITPQHSPMVKSKRPKIKKLATVEPIASQGNTPLFSAQEVISIAVDEVSPVGLLEEDKVLSSVARETTSRLDGAMKKTRFYLAQDQESIGNVSECQVSELADAISEEASVRSERSMNLDDGEDVDDNLSDMVSANVSGRGSPNISGRETPQSMGDVGGADAANPPDLPVTVRKPNTDLTDRFGKFGIETRVDRAMDNTSLVSDSWSTDVYASDSEPPESQYEAGVPPLVPEMISETASESAWSTDVLNSDTSERPIDRLRELDQIEESLGGVDLGSESDAMSTRSTDSRRGEPNSPFVPVRHQGPQAQQQLFPFAHHQPAFPEAPSALDPRRQEVGRLNHSVGSSFVSTSLTLPPQLMNNTYTDSGQLPNHMAPLEPIRTQDNNAANLLDMFDPLSDELATPPIRQAGGGDWVSPTQANSVLPKSTWDPGNRQAALSAQASNAVSNWSRGGTSQQANPAWQAADPWASANKPATTASWGNSASSADWAANQMPVRASPSNQDGKPEAWSATTPQENRSRSWETPPTGNSRASTSSNRFAIIEDDGDINSRSASWNNTAQNRSSAVVMNISTSGQALQNPISIPTSGPVLSVSTASGGAIPKRTMPRTNSQSSTNEETDGTIITPGKRLGKEKKMGLNPFMKKSKRGRSSGKASPMRQLEKGTGRESPAISEPREDLGSSASDDSGKLKRTGARTDSERSEKTESTEDILEKYRTSANNKQTESAGNTASLNLGREEPDEPSTLIYDPDNLEKCLAFADAKKKLRLVLSTPALYSISLMSMYRQLSQSSAPGSRENFLVSYLNVLHSEALLHQDMQLVVQIQETVRCLQRFNNNGCRKLVRAIREEYQSRVHYISYLAKARHKLLSMQARTQGMLLTLNRDKESCFSSLIQECVKVFLEKRDSRLRLLQKNFAKLQSPDEKAAELEECLSFLYAELDRDGMWTGANAVMREAAQLAIERGVMEKVYKSAMFPNADGDTQRDNIYFENVANLAQTVTPNHRKLRIPAVYHLEAPWSSAQAHLKKINAFKTPGDKVQCISQCVNTIMGLLRMAHTKSVPGADDFLPVFIYVLIMANPPNLLSSIQYVDSLYGERMEGEEMYNWTQLNTAVAFIKMWLQESLASDGKG
ncbi:GTPase-activating protein and VPS9 domain-containing protein 1-like [Watersipora subatra]|uniref:GTPase-activating protein and VPS9 domain-containing protein 1-like n=1 Tax=Watersipora subatra TaxID=2589382 RepID=UPI00355C35D2